MTTIQCTDRWKSGRLATLFAENAEKNSNLSSIEALQFRYGEIRPKPIYDLTDDLKETYKKYALVRPNDIMLNGLNLNYDFVTQRVAQVKSNGIITSAYISLRPREGVSAKYYTYLLKTLDSMKVFNGMGTGIRLTLSYNLLRNLELPIPQHEEQDQIARYLDWQVSKINKLIAAKKKQIALLRERAQKLIQDVVFHGITNGRALDTYDGLWIGSIPSDWNVKRIKNLFSLRDERNHMPLTDVNLISLYTSLGVVQNCDVEYKSGNKARTAENYKIVHNGDIVVNIILCWMGAVGLSKYNGVTSPAYDIYVPNSQASSRYYHYLFRLPVFSGECKKVGHGIMAMRWRTYSPEFRSIYVPVPPYEEQEQIADWLDKHMSEIEKLIEPFKQEIDTLHELRTRLISDVVTGQIDVRGIEVPDFDMVEEIDSDEVNLDDEDAAEETEEQEE